MGNHLSCCAPACGWQVGQLSAQMLLVLVALLIVGIRPLVAALVPLCIMFWLAQGT